ncbi:MAG: TonB-dependent receptor [Sphingobacteriaceae bacterium]|nr:TonB-dependent receptor [Sphingobacteriaceae bacterium]
MKKFILVCIIIISTLYANLANAQNKTVQGVVKDIQGAIPGISVVEKGVAGNGVTTDEEGRFRITLKGNSDVLVIKGIGFETQEVRVGNRTSITVNLETSKTDLDEVIIVGFGVQKKPTMTGAASAVSGESIRQNPSASIQNGLVGRLPGFFSQQRTGTPGGDAAAFYIRGVSSLNGSGNTPLIVVDDVEYTYDQLQRIDPNEVENITILKDASTTAIYGIKGANGVLLVTTRRGKTGPAKISFKTEYSLSAFTKLPEYLGSYESAVVYNQALTNDNLAPRWTADDLAKFQSGSDPYTHPNVNWQKALFKDFTGQSRSNLDLQGGTERLRYFISAGFINQDGQTKNYSNNSEVNGNYFHKRYNYRANMDLGVTKDLDLRFDLAGNYGEVNTPNIFFSSTNGNNNNAFYEYNSFLSLAPWAYPIKNPDGSWGYSNWQRQESGGGNYNAGNIIQRLSEFGYNRSNESNITFNTTANQKLGFILPGLSVKGTLAYTSNYGYNRGMTRQRSPSFVYNPVNETYTPRDPAVYDTEPLSRSYTPRYTYRALTAQAFINYEGTFGRNHHVRGMLLHSRDNKVAQSGQSILNFVPEKTVGYTARVSYDYKQKYLLEFNAGYNASDRFTTDKRFGFFPALSIGWNVADEGFIKNNVSWLNQFKIRSSYGEVGQDKLNSNQAYSFLQVYSPNNGIYITDFGTSSNTMTGLQEGPPGNNVTWEVESKLDIGVDFAMFNRTVSGTVDYFFNKRSDILIPRQTVSEVLGADLPAANLGRTQNRGYEFELNYRKELLKDFRISLKGLYSFAKNKVLFNDSPPAQYAHQDGTGRSMGDPLLYKFIGFYTEAEALPNSGVPKPAVTPRPGDLKYADIAGGPDGGPDGKITNADRGFFGNPNLPNTNYGFHIGGGYKSFNFNLVFQGAKNFSLGASELGIIPFGSNVQPIHQQAWTPELGDNAKFPRLSLVPGASAPGTYNSDFWYKSGNYLRLRTAEISYAIPASIVSKMKVQGIRLYANGNNLITWSKIFDIYNLDPEATPNGRNGQYMDYPPSKMYNFGINVTF